MSGAIRSPKDFWAGLLYAVCGAAAVIISRNYGMGTPSRMGPAYFPTVLGGLLLLIGFVSLARSFFVAGEAIGAIAWKAMVLVTLATLLFGVLLRPVGLVAALVALMLVSAAASIKFRLEWRALGLMACLIVFCGLVFVKGLGLPVSLLGTWFTA
jgi:hypothetical protein